MSNYPNGNPKAAAAKGKAQFNAIPTPALRELGGAMQQGHEKYGLVNWRVPGQEVSASTYIDAMTRHLHAWMEGQRCSDDTTHIFATGVHHLGHVMACCAILIDAELGGHLIDDRPCSAEGKRPGEISKETVAETCARVLRPESMTDAVRAAACEPMEYAELSRKLLAGESLVPRDALLAAPDLRQAETKRRKRRASKRT